MRADFGAQSREALDVRSAARSSAMSLQDAVRAALSLGGRPASRVLVLCEDLWCQPVALSAVQTQGLSREAIAQALGFEIEPFSNMSPVESAVGYAVLDQADGMSQYWAVECTNSELATVRVEVEKAGARLLGISHPGGLPTAIDEADLHRPWQRTENWSRGALLIRADGSDGARVSVQSVASAQVSRDAEWPPAECGQWLQAWAHCLSECPESLALIRPLPAVTTAFRYLLIGLAAEAIVAALCLGHWGWSSFHRGRMRAELAAIQEHQGRIAAVESENARLRQSASQLLQAKREREELDRSLIRRRSALSRLLHALADVRPADIVLQKIQDEGNGNHLLSGMGMRASSGDELSVRLGNALRDSGTTVEPVSNTAEGLLDNSGPWRFALRATFPEAAGAAIPPVGSAAAGDGAL